CFEPHWPRITQYPSWWISDAKPDTINKIKTLSGINYSNLPVTYHSNPKAWMRNDIFAEWLKDLDNQFRLQNQKILLLLDNTTSYFNPKLNSSDEEPVINDEYLEDNFSSNSNNDDFSDNGNDSEFDNIYSSDNFLNDDNDSLPDYDFSKYDDFSDNYSGPSDDYEN
ncbi:37413_t:CDS:2, partial [Gigaspora margarita]